MRVDLKTFHCGPFARKAGFCTFLLTSISLAGCTVSPPEQHSETPQQLASLAPAAGGEDNNSLLRMANAMAAEGAYSAAIPVYRRAYQKNGDTQSLVALGKALSAVGQYQEAANVFKASDAPSALRGLANAYTAMGHPDESLPVLDKILDKNPIDVDALDSRAVTLDSLGRHDEAVASYEKGLQIDPQHTGLRHNYGLSLALAGTDFPRALELLKATNTGANATAAERQSLALAYSLAGDDETASRLLTIDQGIAEAQKNLAYFQIIKALPMAERFQAVMAGSVKPKPAITGPEVRNYGAVDDKKTETAARIIKDAAPAQAAAIEASPQPEVTTPKPEPVAAASPAPEKPAAKLETPVIKSNGEVPAQASTKDWTIQIASYRLTPNLEKGWKILRGKYGDILENLEPSYVLVDFGDRAKRPKGKYYRLLSGPMKNRSEAIETCRKLRARGAECLVRAPGSAAG